MLPAIALLLCFATELHGQRQPSSDSVDVHYYDRWPGHWHRIVGDRVDSLPTFEVTRGPGNSFLERWYLTVDGKRASSAGLRSWDTATRTWRLVWVADPDLFQIWDGIREADGWYIIRKFGDGADAFLSRQAWIPQGANRMLRTIERSTDAGKTWTTRYRDEFQRVSPQ